MSWVQHTNVVVEIWGGLFCIIAAICTRASRHYNKIAAGCLAGLLSTQALINIADVFAMVYRGRTDETGFIIVRVSNFLVFALNYALLFFIAKYLYSIVKERGGTMPVSLRNILYLAMMVGFCLLVASRIFGFYYAFDEQNRYYRLNDTYWILACLPLLLLIILITLATINRKLLTKSERIAVFFVLSVPIVGTGLQLLVYGVSIINLLNTFSALFVFGAYEVTYSYAMIRRERHLREIQIRTYQSQIKPHFIYNSLAAIRSKVPEGSEAEEIINEFTKFLRGSMDMLPQTESIPFEREFETVKSYLYMVNVRFGGKIKTRYEIEDTDFKVPPFAMQTLVENSVKHGIRNKPTGEGTVTIRTFKNEEGHVVEIEDDGVGIDKDAFAKINARRVKSSTVDIDSEREVHVGIENTESRLELMCKGRMEIETTPGKGAKVRLIIPD